MFRSKSFFRPWIRASYLAMLLAQSNSNLQTIHVLFPFGSIRRQPAPIPSFDFDPSKYSVQGKLFTTTLLSLIYTKLWFSTLFTEFYDAELGWI